MTESTVSVIAGETISGNLLGAMIDERLKTRCSRRVPEIIFRIIITRICKCSH